MKAHIFERFANDESGAGYVEFLMISPILLILFIGSVEAPMLIKARTSIEVVSSTAADLTSQGVSIDENTMRGIFDATKTMLEQDLANATGLDMTVTSLLSCETGPGSGIYEFSVIWSHGYDASGMKNGRVQDSIVPNVPQELGLQSNSTIIMAETSYQYTPPVGGIIVEDGTITLANTSYFRPRRSREVAHMGSQSRGQAMLCD